MTEIRGGLPHLHHCGLELFLIGWIKLWCRTRVVRGINLLLPTKFLHGGLSRITLKGEKTWHRLAKGTKAPLHRERGTTSQAPPATSVCMETSAGWLSKERRVDTCYRTDQHSQLYMEASAGWLSKNRRPDTYLGELARRSSELRERRA